MFQVLNLLLFSQGSVALKNSATKHFPAKIGPFEPFRASLRNVFVTETAGPKTGSVSWSSVFGISTLDFTVGPNQVKEGTRVRRRAQIRRPSSAGLL